MLLEEALAFLQKHQIDALERVARNLPPRVRTAARPEPLLAVAGLLLGAEVALMRVFGRRLP